MCDIEFFQAMRCIFSVLHLQITIFHCQNFKLVKFLVTAGHRCKRSPFACDTCTQQGDWRFIFDNKIMIVFMKHISQYFLIVNLFVFVAYNLMFNWNCCCFKNLLFQVFDSHPLFCVGYGKLKRRIKIQIYRHCHLRGGLFFISHYTHLLQVPKYYFLHLNSCRSLHEKATNTHFILRIQNTDFGQYLQICNFFQFQAG